MVYKIVVKKTKELSSRYLRDLYEIKDQNWQHGQLSQRKWFEDNINSDDYHILIYCEKEIVAYANLVEIEISLDSQKYNAVGVGNVCTSKIASKRGYGTLLMSSINVLLKKWQLPGFLLCKDTLVPFYESNRWQKLDTSCLIVNNKTILCQIMCHNLDTKFKSVEAKTIEINRLF